MVEWLEQRSQWKRWDDPAFDYDDIELVKFVEEALPKELGVRVSPVDDANLELAVLCISQVTYERGCTIPAGDSIEDPKYMPPLTMSDNENSKDMKLKNWLLESASSYFHPFHLAHIVIAHKSVFRSARASSTVCDPSGSDGSVGQAEARRRARESSRDQDGAVLVNRIDVIYSMYGYELYPSCQA